MGPIPVIAAGAITALNYVVLTVSDMLAVACAGLRLSRRRIALAAFVGYAVSNTVGFALVSGTSSRYRFYSRWGIRAADFARIVLFYSATFWLGPCVVGGLALLIAPPTGIASVLGRPATQATGVLPLALVAAYVILCARGRPPLRLWRLTIAFPRPQLAAAQVVVSTVDWLLAAAVLFICIPAPRPPFFAVAGAFSLAQVVGLVSSVPAGLGVFEGAMVLLLAPAVRGTDLIPAFAWYRAIYYLAPLAIAAVILAVDEGIVRRRLVMRWSRACHTAAAWAAPRALAAFAFVSGIVLLASGATPSDPGRLAWLATVMPLALVEASHFAASLAGVLLLVLAQAIARRVDAAFYVAAAALAVGVAGSLLKGGDYEEAAVLLAALFALCAGRRHFTRRARIFDNPAGASWLLAVGSVVAASTWLGFFAYRHVAYSNALWWRFAFDADAPRFLRASVAVTIVTLAIAVRQLLRPVLLRPSRERMDPAADIDRAVALQPRTAAYLAYLGDKLFLWNESRSAFLMYAVQGRSCIALGEPIGAPAAAHDLIGRFLAMARTYDLTPVFYEASGDRLTDFVEFGLAMVKVGEEARVPLERFTLTGSRFKALRAAVNQAERHGIRFRVAEASELPALLPQLQEVSDEWLALKGASEKGFSLGYFDAAYLRRFPVALLERDGRIEAFANLWPGPGRVELSPDLMRHRATAPAGTMDALFVHVMRWGREHGYQWFNLGVAPLSGLHPSPGGRTWLRLARFVYGHGEGFYNFQGLRAYKEKFDPVWEPRYLVYPGGLALPRVLADVTALVAGGYHRIFVRAARSAA